MNIAQQIACVVAAVAFVAVLVGVDQILVRGSIVSFTFQ